LGEQGIWGPVTFIPTENKKLILIDLITVQWDKAILIAKLWYFSCNFLDHPPFPDVPSIKFEQLKAL